jgi:hypothetical protein
MRLATLAAYRDMVYAEGSAPTLPTLRKRIREIPGGRIEFGKYFVDLDANDRVNKLSDSIHDRLDELRKDPLLDGLI